MGLIVKETKWIIIEMIAQKPKTSVYSVISKCDDSKLGEIKWYPPWRHYCFLTTIAFQTVHSDRCLISLGEFVRDLNEKHKESRGS